MSEEIPQMPKKIDWHDVRQKTIAGVITAAVLALLGGLGAYIWNDVSRGGLVRALGGVTQAEFESRLKQLSSAGSLNDDLANAVIAFDGSCPPGWKLSKEAVGSAIVGVGATMVGETGEPLPDLYRRNAPSKQGSIKQKPREPDLTSNGDYWEPISRYVQGIKTAMVPTYWPLTYCKRDTELDLGAIKRK